MGMTAKRGLEGAIHTIQAEVDAMLGAAKNAEEKAKKAMVDAARLADELRELEAELAGTQARTGEAGKAYQRAERKCKELVFSSGEDKKNQDRMTDLASKLQSRSRPTSSRSR